MKNSLYMTQCRETFVIPAFVFLSSRLLFTRTILRQTRRTSQAAVARIAAGCTMYMASRRDYHQTQQPAVNKAGNVCHMVCVHVPFNRTWVCLLYGQHVHVLHVRHGYPCNYVLWYHVLWANDSVPLANSKTILKTILQLSFAEF